MDRTRKSLINITFNITNQFVTLVLGFVARMVFIHTLGVEFLGINGLFTDVLGMLSMADLGFNTAMVYSFYKPIAEDNRTKISALITFYRKVYNIIALVVTIIGLSLTPFIKFIVNTENEIPLLNIYYLFALASVIISYLFVYKTSIITADQKNYFVTRITIISTFLKTIFQIISLIFFKSFIIYLALGVLFNFINNFIASRKAVQLYPYIKNKVEIEEKDKKEIFLNIRSVFIYKVSSVLLNATDNAIISVMLGTAIVGYYSNYLMLNNKIVSVFSLFFTSMTASIGNLIVKDSFEKRYEVFDCEQTISFIICGVVVSSFFALSNEFIMLWLGKEYVMENTVIVMISLNLYLSCVLQPLWSYREATGLYQKTKWIMLIAAIINLVMSVILGKILGLPGILLASAIARISTYIWYEPKLLFKLYFQKSCKGYFLSLIKNVVIVISISLILYFIDTKWVTTNWFLFVLKTVLFGVISFVFVVLFYYKSKGFYIILNRFINIGKGFKI